MKRGFMRAARAARSAPFRAALWNAVLFGVAAGAALAVLWTETAGVRRDGAQRAVQAEIAVFNQTLARVGPFGGAAGLAREVSVRGARAPDGAYLLATRANRRPLAGNVPPEVALAALDEARARDGEAWDGWFEFAWRGPADENGGEAERRVVLARALSFGRDGLLIVGRRVDGLAALEATLTRVILWGGALAILGGLTLGALAGWRAARRVEGMRRALSTIRERGDLTRRLPAAGGDEIARLGEEVNAMLARLEALMEGMRQVSGDVAHEMRSPLGRLRNRLERALAAEPADEGARDALARALDEVDRVLRAFDALLRIARAESGALDAPETMTDVDAAEVLVDVGELYAPVAEERGARLSVAKEGPLIVKGHRELLFQALVNLVENALSHGVPDGRPARLALTAGAETDDEGRLFAVLEARDNGPGVPPEARARAMERFVRLNADAGRVKGSGLGLALARAAARAHGGQLILAAAADGGPGLCARLRLPLRPRTRRESEPAPPASQEKTKKYAA